MKKIITTTISALFAIIIFAQAPQGITHQAVIRNATNELVINSPIGIKVSIIQNSAEGTVVYCETHLPTSNANGLISYVIGQGTVESGVFAEIDWSVGPYFLKTEADPMGGTDYSITGVTQFLSMPYALYSETAKVSEKVIGSISSNIQPPKVLVIDADPINEFSATINGIVNGEGFSTTVVIEWGTSTAYGNTVTAIQSPVTGSDDVAVHANLSGLQAATTYHYRIRATNAVDEVYSDDMIFTTDASVLYNLYLEVHPENTGNVLGAGEYQEGAIVSITATANTGWEFVNWSGDTVHLDDPDSEEATVTMPAGSVMLTANFEEEEETTGPVPIPNDEIDEATFVDLDFSAFPVLPEYVIPEINTFFVSISGNDITGDGSENNPYRSIDKALHEASENYTIIVREGQYAECFESSLYPGWTGDDRSLVINKNNISLIAYPGEDVELIPATTQNTGIELSGNNTIIRGINISGFEYGILFWGSASTAITNTVIANLEITLITSIWSIGIEYQHDAAINGLLVFDVTVANAGHIGIHCGSGYAYNWRIENTRILMDNQGGGWGADAFAIEHGDNILLVNSEFTGAGADGIDTKATRVVVYGCHVHNVGHNGIKLWHGGDIINTIVNHTGADASVSAIFDDTDGLRFRLLHSIVAYHNYGGGTSYNLVLGYEENPTMQVEIINSAIFNTSGGMYVSSQADLTISHSLFHSIENNQILEHGGTNVYITDGPDGLNPYGAGNLVQDPIVNNFFYPQLNSPLINAGIELIEHYPQKDKDGNSRIIDGTPDIGPFELNN